MLEGPLCGLSLYFTLWFVGRNWVALENAQARFKTWTLTGLRTSADAVLDATLLSWCMQTCSGICDESG